MVCSMRGGWSVAFVTLKGALAGHDEDIEDSLRRP